MNLLEMFKKLNDDEKEEFVKLIFSKTNEINIQINGSISDFASLVRKELTKEEKKKYTSKTLKEMLTKEEKKNYTLEDLKQKNY